MKKQRTGVPVYEVAQEGDVWRVLRNGRPLMTPAGQVYDLPRLRFAQEIAREWGNQGKKAVPSTMPLTQLAATALDLVSKDRARITETLAAYAPTELLCLRAQGPQSLRMRQEELWQPLLDWCAERFGAELRTSCGVMPVLQREEADACLRRVLNAFDDFVLTGVRFAAETSGSLVLALALEESRLTAAQAFEACALDETHQAEKWGGDPVTESRHKAVCSDLETVALWFEMAKK